MSSTGTIARTHPQSYAFLSIDAHKEYSFFTNKVLKVK